MDRFKDDQRVLDFFRMIINDETTSSLQVTFNRFNVIYSIHFLQSCEESKIEFISIILRNCIKNESNRLNNQV